MNMNSFLPILATAVLACLPEFTEKQLQKANGLNPIGYYLPCSARNVFKFRKHEKLDGDFNCADSEFFGLILFDQSGGLVRTPLLEPCGHDTPHVEPFLFWDSIHLLKNHH